MCINTERYVTSCLLTRTAIDFTEIIHHHTIQIQSSHPCSYMGLPSQEHQREPEPALPLVRLNHVAFSCTSVDNSIDFYRRVLGFQLIQRPASLDFGGAW